jgi:hypothetical protein
MLNFRITKQVIIDVTGRQAQARGRRKDIDADLDTIDRMTAGEGSNGVQVRCEFCV